MRPVKKKKERAKKRDRFTLHFRVRASMEQSFPRGSRVAEVDGEESSLLGAHVQMVGLPGSRENDSERGCSASFECATYPPVRNQQ